MKNALFVLVVLLVCPIFSKAAIITGCAATASGGSGNIYSYTEGGSNGGVPTYINLNQGFGGSSGKYDPATVFCYSGLVNPHGSCYIEGRNGAGSADGTLVTFSTSPTDCPIDGYVPLLLISFSFLSVFWIRKRVEFSVFN